MLPNSLSLLASTVLIVFCALCLVAGVWRELFPGAPPPPPSVKRLPAAILIIVNGVLIVIALAALVGIWMGR